VQWPDDVANFLDGRLGAKAGPSLVDGLVAEVREERRHGGAECGFVERDGDMAGGHGCSLLLRFQRPGLVGFSTRPSIVAGVMSSTAQAWSHRGKVIGDVPASYFCTI
jgi:hypothetical protein